MGRPAKRPKSTDAGIADQISVRLIGGESLRSISEDPEMPSINDMYVTMARDEVFRAVIARAREAQQEAEIDKTIELADSATPETVQMVKLQIWARQWRAGKLAPKRYGDKVEHAVTGSDGGPVQNTLTIEYVRPKAAE